MSVETRSVCNICGKATEWKEGHNYPNRPDAPQFELTPREGTTFIYSRYRKKPYPDESLNGRWIIGEVQITNHENGRKMSLTAKEMFDIADQVNRHFERVYRDEYFAHKTVEGDSSRNKWNNQKNG